MGNYLVGIDLGTTGAKSCVFDLDGNVVGSDYEEYGMCYVGQFLEQKGPEMTAAMFETCKNAIERSGIDNKEIAGVAFSTQAGVGIYLDENYEPLRDFISWQDTRGVPYWEEYFSKISPEEMYKVSGHPLKYAVIPSKTLWVQHNQPEVWEKVKHIASPQDYMLRQFGADECYIDLSSAGRNMWLNTITNTYSEELLNAFNVTEDMLPKICGEAGKVVGYIKKEVAERTGLPEGCPICMGSHDQDCSTLGGGGWEAGKVIMTVGTLTTCSVISEKPFRSEDGTMICNSKQGTGNWTTEQTGCCTAAAFQWFRDTLSKAEKKAAQEEGMNPYDYLTSLVGEGTPGADGVKFIGDFHSEKGTFSGISLRTSMGNMVQAVLEGVAYEMKLLLDEAVASTHTKVTEICLAGGMVKSPRWCQMMSDILQCKVLINKSKEVGCLGAAIFAGIGAGIFANPKEGGERMVKVDRCYEPNKERQKAYEESYQAWKELRQQVCV